MRTGQGTPLINIAWIDKLGRVTLARGVRPGGDVQSVYFPSSRLLWMLVARPHLPLDLTMPRHYVFASLDPSGAVHVAVGGKASWPIQTRSAMSFGGDWMPRGVFWTYNTFELLRPLGLNWVDARGDYHPPDQLALPFGGDPSMDMAPGSGPSLWTSVATHDSGNPLPDGIIRVDESRPAFRVRRYDLPAHVDVVGITQDEAGGYWFAYRDGRIAHIEARGSISTFRWQSRDDYPVAMVTATDRGVWVIGETTVDHFTAAGRLVSIASPGAWRTLRFPVAAVMSPCGVVWLSQTTGETTSELSSRRIPGVSQKGCMDAATIRWRSYTAGTRPEATSRGHTSIRSRAARHTSRAGSLRTLPV